MRYAKDAASSRAPRLAELQRWLSWKIRGSVDKPPRMDCARAIASVPPLSRARRIGVYAVDYEERLHEALSRDFPLTRERVGARAFRRLVRDYLAATKRREWSVSFAGRGLAAFLRKSAHAAKDKELPRLAELEWHKLLSFHAADGERWDVSDLAALGPSQWSRLRLGLAPSAFLSSYERTLVYRHGFEVRTRTLSRDQWAFLRRLERGESLGRCLDAIRDETAPVGEWLKQWASDGVLSRRHRCR